jgi:dienelactone hydrolase
LLALLQVVVSIAFPVEIPPEVLRIEEYRSDQVDVLYLGDSTLIHPVGEPTIGEILQEMLPDHTVGELAHPAYNLDLYLYYVRYAMRGARRPRVVVVPINMRSFSPEWDLRPGYQFEKEKKILTLGLSLSRVLSRPLATFGAYDPPISQDVYLNTTVYNGDTPVGTVKDFENLTEESGPEQQGNTEFAYHDDLPSPDDAEALRQALIYRYMVGLEPDHRQLQAALRIAALGEAHGVDVVFYITPINYQQGQQVLDEAFSASLDKSRELVRATIAGSTEATILDLGSDLEAYAFVDMEHLREPGKVYVAEQLAATIRPERSVASSGDGGDVMPALPSPASSKKTPTVTSTPNRSSDVSSTPTATRPAPTPAETRVLTATIAASTTMTASPPISITEEAAPLATIAVSPTPTTTSVVQDVFPGGTIVGAEYLGRSRPEDRYPVDMYRLRYETRDERGQIVETRADLFVPSVEPAVTYPVLVYAAGTTGVSSDCAPLNEMAWQRNWGNYRVHAITWATRGYVVILPNGLGFDDADRVHPYFIAELEAYVLLDAARAVYNFADHPLAEDVSVQPASAVFMMGYSSGGHAVFAAKDRAGSYAPELSVQGIIGYGPTTNVETLLKEDPVFSPYIVYAYRDFYGSEVVDVADVYLDRWVATFESDVLAKCVDDVFSYYSRSARQMYSLAFRDVLYGDRLDQVHPLLAEKLSENNAGLSGGDDIPVLILQGTGDTVVTPDSQRAFRDRLCERGTSVTYLEYPAVPHTQIRWTSFNDTVAWMQRIAAGELPEMDCR